MKLEKYIYREDFSFSTRDADFMKKIRISSLINFFIQAAWKHAEELGVGYSHLSEIGVGWILSRLNIKIHHLPSWPGDINISTWPKGVDRILYIRDAEIHSSSDIKLASISSAWLVIDMETKRLKRSFPEVEFFTKLEMHDAIQESIPALKFVMKECISTPYRVSANDIDMNMHLTTIRYFDLMFDTYDLEFLTANTPKEIVVNFMKEVPFGTELVMSRAVEGNTHFFELCNSTSSDVCFRAEVKY